MAAASPKGGPHETPVVTKFLRERPDDSWTIDAARAHNHAYETVKQAFGMERDAHAEGVDAIEHLARQQSGQEKRAGN